MHQWKNLQTPNTHVYFIRAMYGIENLLVNDGSVYWYVESFWKMKGSCEVNISIHFSFQALVEKARSIF